MLDLEAYFARIGYMGSRSPTLETLHNISDAHVRTIPFENLDVLLGVPIRLEPDALEAKLVHARRGGYCFEQNSLLLHVLAQLGFTVAPLSARVRYGRPRDYTPARTHLLVRVELDESWLADIGVGAMSLTRALRLAELGAQATLHDTRRLLRENDRIYHQVLFGERWEDVAEITLEEMPLIDRVVANWYTSTHPESHFKHRLLVARAAADGSRITVLNRAFTVRDRTGGHVVDRTIATPDELLDILAEHFGLAFPAGTRFPCTGLDWP